jgi:hypothetical protein
VSVILCTVANRSREIGVCVLAILVGGCSSGGGKQSKAAAPTDPKASSTRPSAIAASQTTTASGLATPDAVHFCVGGRSPGPPAAMTVTTRGHPGNEWHIVVGSKGLLLQVAVTQRPDTFVRSATFQVRTPDWDHVVKHFPVHQNWKPGLHDVRIEWDGRDDAGQPLAPGVYSFTLGARVDSQKRVSCADGSGEGTERNEGGSEGYGLGKFLIQRD